MENIVDVSKIRVEKQYLACDIWTTLSALACFWQVYDPEATHEPTDGLCIYSDNRKNHF